MINKTFLFLSFFSFLFLKMFYLQRWNNSLKYSRSYRWNLEIAIVLYNHTPDVIITISIRSIKYPVPIYFERKRNYNLHFEKRFSMRENNFHQFFNNFLFLPVLRMDKSIRRNASIGWSTLEKKTCQNRWATKIFRDNFNVVFITRGRAGLASLRSSIVYNHVMNAGHPCGWSINLPF